MKAFGHTKTLFIEGGKYKWARKHNYCTYCLSAKNPHKGNGLCLSCFDKKRAEKRKGALKRQNWKHYYKKRLLFILDTPNEYRKKPGIKYTGFNQKEYRKKWYRENRDIMLLKGEIKRRRKKGLPCLEMRINGKEYFFPFETIEKPNTLHSKDPFIWRKYDEWKENMQKYELLYNWYHK